MNSNYKKSLPALLALALWTLPGIAAANDTYTQCGPGNTLAKNTDTPTVKCMHLSAGDGYVKMADGQTKYIFGFSDLTNVNNSEALVKGLLAANFPAPTIELKQGQEFYLSLTNIGMVIRPDLFDPHTVHFHGFPNASAVFDGVPDNSISINAGATLTYFYNIVEPGTFMYHCHVEATEHMQMGMLGNLYVHPAQDGTPIVAPDGKTYSSFVYNDVDGSTGYDVEAALQLGSFDPAFHDASENVQPLPFAAMHDTYGMINGRGYPDTVNPAPLPAPAAVAAYNPTLATTQPMTSLVNASPGDRVLLRISNLNVTNFYTVTALGLPMEVVGQGAAIRRGPGGDNLYYKTNSVTLGGGEAKDVMVRIPDTATVGDTYFVYTTNLEYLNNDAEEFGGMMTEIRIQ